MIQTRHTENKFTATSPEEMFGHYAAERILHTWTEDFKDEDTGEVVSIERHQPLFEKGTFFDNRNIDSVRFYFEAGQLKQALVSDQNRMGTVIEHYGLQAYKVKVKVSDKNHVIICQASSLSMAQAIVEDWCELHFNRTFIVTAVSEMNAGVILNSALKRSEEISTDAPKVSAKAENVSTEAEKVSEEPLSFQEEEGDGADQQEEAEAEEEKPEEEEKFDPKKKCGDYYEITLTVSYKKTESGIIRSDHIGFIVNATDADAAREACFGWIDLHREDDESVDKVTIIDAKPLNCTKVIEREFSMSYVDAEANNSNNN